MNKLPEEVRYKNYLFHPIWETTESVKEIFRVKGYELREYDSLTSATYRIILSDIVNNRASVILIKQNPDRKEILAFKKKLLTFLETWRIKEPALRFEDAEGNEHSVPLFKIIAQSNIYVAFRDSRDIIKYLYVAIPAKKEPKFDKIFRKAIQSGGDTVRRMSKGDLIQRDSVVSLMRSAYSQVTGEDAITIGRYEDFLQSFEREIKNEDEGIPLFVKTYYMLRNKMPSGWQLAVDFNEDKIYARFNEPVIVNNAYVNDKITPLKVPLWIEKIYLRIRSDGRIEAIQGVGFHCDMSGATMNAFKSICYGDIDINLKKHIQANDIKKAIGIFDNLPRQLSVTNLDHPHWQFSSVQILSDIQVIGYDPNKIDDMVITDAPAEDLAIDNPEDATGDELRATASEILRRTGARLAIDAEALANELGDL